MIITFYKKHFTLFSLDLSIWIFTLFFDLSRKNNGLFHPFFYLYKFDYSFTLFFKFHFANFIPWWYVRCFVEAIKTITEIPLQK